MPLDLFFWIFENFPAQGRFDVLVINHLSGNLDLINTDVAHLKNNLIMFTIYSPL